MTLLYVTTSTDGIDSLLPLSMHDIHFVNYGPIESKTDKLGYALCCFYCKIDKLLFHPSLRFRLNQDRRLAMGILPQIQNMVTSSPINQNGDGCNAKLEALK